MNLKHIIKWSNGRRMAHKLPTMARCIEGILPGDWNPFGITGYWTVAMQRAEERAVGQEIMWWPDDGAGRQMELANYQQNLNFSCVRDRISWFSQPTRGSDDRFEKDEIYHAIIICVMRASLISDLICLLLKGSGVGHKTCGGSI